jgi:hypothetical protein
MPNIPPPPVPQPLREMLKDYPELIEELQRRLIDLMSDHARSIPMFEQAIWLLQDALSAFRSNANKELKAAEQSGDSALIEKAKTKRFLIGRARNESPWSENREFWNYFQTYREAFE